MAKTATVTTSATFRFDAANVSAQKVAAKQAGKMVTQITAETQAAIRSIIVKSISTGVPVYDAARMIKPLIGLTERQAQAALNFRSSLIDLGLTLDKVNGKVDRYAAKLLTRRAQTIARTEVMAALNRGAQESYKQAQREGLLSKTATKEWITTPDEKLCPTCEPMDGVTVSLSGEFSVGGPPAHPSCRCTIGINP